MLAVSSHQFCQLSAVIFHLVCLFPVALLVPPVECERIQEDDGGVLSVALAVGQGLEVLHQLDHGVVVLDLPVEKIGLVPFSSALKVKAL